jgi:hypothetical protein
MLNWVMTIEVEMGLEECGKPRPPLNPKLVEQNRLAANDVLHHLRREFVDVERLREIAEVEFADIVTTTTIPDANELRVFLTDGSFVDVWFSLKLRGRYSFHWKRQALDGTIYRHDNAPHRR